MDWLEVSDCIFCGTLKENSKSDHFKFVKTLVYRYHICDDCDFITTNVSCVGWGALTNVGYIFLNIYYCFLTCCEKPDGVTALASPALMTGSSCFEKRPLSIQNRQAALGRDLRCQMSESVITDVWLLTTLSQPCNSVSMCLLAIFSPLRNHHDQPCKNHASSLASQAQFNSPHL